MCLNKLTRIVLLAMFTMCFSVAVYAAGNGSIVKSYSESFIPVEGKDAVLNVEMKVIPDHEGNVYIPVNVDKSKLTAVQVNGKAVTAFKDSKIGAVPYFQVKAGVFEEPVKVTGQIVCPNFFGGKKSNPSTGIPTQVISYQYINKSENKVGSYSVKIALPAGMEPLSVTAPKSVTNYELGMEGGNRTFYYEVKKGIAPSGSAAVAFSYGVPFSEQTSILTVIWLLILGISGVVIYKRLGGEKII